MNAGRSQQFTHPIAVVVIHHTGDQGDICASAGSQQRGKARATGPLPRLFGIDYRNRRVGT
ncbi:hypothetical protein MBOL_23400 [Mycobacteroides abscessus subsp. bolletii BD]|nr:hypothetical protein MBOL_23400 [Mycobacteroides abscessus subsp. bolletii BD]